MHVFAGDVGLVAARDPDEFQRNEAVGDSPVNDLLVGRDQQHVVHVLEIDTLLQNALRQCPGCAVEVGSHAVACGKTQRAKLHVGVGRVVLFQRATEQAVRRTGDVAQLVIRPVRVADSHGSRTQPGQLLFDRVQRGAGQDVRRLTELPLRRTLQQVDREQHARVAEDRMVVFGRRLGGQVSEARVLASDVEHVNDRVARHHRVGSSTVHAAKRQRRNDAFIRVAEERVASEADIPRRELRGLRQDVLTAGVLVAVRGEAVLVGLVVRAQGRVERRQDAHPALAQRVVGADGLDGLSEEAKLAEGGLLAVFGTGTPRQATAGGGLRGSVVCGLHRVSCLVGGCP